MKFFFKQLNSIFNVLLGVQILFCALALTIIKNSPPPTAIVVKYNGDNTYAQPISTAGVLVLVFLMSVIMVIYLIDSQRKTQGSILQGLKEKLDHYRQTSIIRLALIEAAALLAIFVAMKENSIIYLLSVIASLLIFLYFRPTMEKFIREYQLTPAEEDLIRS